MDYRLKNLGKEFDIRHRYQCYACGREEVVCDETLDFKELGYNGNGITYFYHCEYCGAIYECKVVNDKSKEKFKELY